MIRRLLPAILIAAAGLTGWALHRRPALAPVPRAVLWAWQRPESLSYVDPHHFALAVLAETVTLSTPPRFEPRMQPVAGPPGATWIAVVRLQAPLAPDLSPASRAQIVDRIVALAAQPQTRALQIDFDATLSQRDFYRTLVTELRARLPKAMPLSITALVSWCSGDDWIHDLPVDEAVPMYFRLGVNEANVRRSLMDVRALHEPLCRNSVGLSLDEPWPRFDRDVRAYIFAPAPWTQTDYHRVLERLAP